MNENEFSAFLIFSKLSAFPWLESLVRHSSLGPAQEIFDNLTWHWEYL